MKIRFRFYLSAALVLLSFAARAQDSATDNHKIDSLLLLLKAPQTDPAKMHALNTLAGEYISESRYADALHAVYELKALALKAQRSAGPELAKAGYSGEAQAWDELGKIHYNQGSLTLALDYYNIALAIYTRLNNKDGLAELYTNIGSTYSAQGDYNRSLDNYLKSLKIDEEMHDERQVAIDYANVAALMDDSKNTSRAGGYLFKAMALHQKLGDTNAIGLCLNNLGTLYQERADSAEDEGNHFLAKELYLLADQYFERSLKIHETYDDEEGIAIACENIGTTAMFVGQLNKALDYLQRALSMYKRFGYKAETSYCYNNLGKTYQKMGNIAEAEKCFRQSLELASETASNDFIMQSNKFLSDFYNETNRPAEALKYYKDYIKYHDKIFNQQNSQKLLSSEMNYDFEKKQALSKAQHEKEIVKLEGDNKNQRQLRLFLFIVIGFCIVVLVAVQRAYNNKKRLAALLEAEDSRKELLLQEVHHRINNNLQIISSLLSLQANSAEDERLNVYLKQSQNRIQSLSALHELLYQNNTSQRVDMRDYIDKILDFHRDVAATLPAKVTIATDVKPVPFPSKIAVPLALIINELVTNSLKYAFAGRSDGRIDVVLEAADAEQQRWKLVVKDNGKGMGEVSERRKGSLGLRLVHIMLRQIAAELKTGEGPGAIFEMSFTIKELQTV